MKIFFQFLLCVAVGTCAFASDAKKVYLVANSNVPEGIALAKDYAKKRGVPESNIIELNLPDKQHISAGEYFGLLENPLMDKLAQLGALNAEKTGNKVFEGRDEMKFKSHEIDYIILFMGVPIGILPTDGQYGMKTDAASVDSELSARFAPMKDRKGIVKNPMFGAFKNADDFKKIGLLRVFRIDAPTAENARKIVDSCLRAERRGLRGRAYVDKSHFVESGDEMLDKTAQILKKMNFDLSVDPDKPLFDYNKRMDAAALYFGWYSYTVEKYFADRGFKMADGAVSVHIFSFSAKDMRNARSWTPRFASLGTSFAAGNVFEPYLHLTHNTAALALAVARGNEIGECAYAAQPALSWQTVNVGDPLFRPSEHSLSEQIADIERGEVDELSQYSVTRAMNAAESQKGLSAAIAVGKHYLPKLKDAYALNWKLSQKYFESGAVGEAVKYALAAAGADIYKRPDLQGLAMEIAEFLSKNGKAAGAVEIYETLAKNRRDLNFGRVLLKFAVPACSQAGMPLPENIAKIKSAVEADDAAKELAKKKAAEKAKTEPEKK